MQSLYTPARIGVWASLKGTRFDSSVCHTTQVTGYNTSASGGHLPAPLLSCRKPILACFLSKYTSGSLHPYGKSLALTPPQVFGTAG